MNIESALKSKFEHAHLSKGNWGRDEQEASELKLKKGMRSLRTVSVLIAIGAMISFIAGYFIEDYWTVFLAIAVLFLVMFLTIAILYLIIKRKIKRIISEINENPAYAAVHRIRQQECVRYYSGIMTENVNDDTMLSIASCIKERISDESESYTFNIIASSPVKVTEALSGKQWTLHDGYSPFFVSIARFDIKDTENKMVEVDIYITKDSEKELHDVIERIKSGIQKCIMDRIVPLNGEK